jgi:predicted nuclease of predicted toxin-antitoxin system
MQFKIDENLPIELATTLREAGHNSETVHSEELTGASDQDLSAICQKENRVLITLDIGFTDIRTYPPADYAGFIVFRLKRQDNHHVLNIVRKILPTLETEKPAGYLWIAEENRIRIRS